MAQSQELPKEVILTCNLETEFLGAREAKEGDYGDKSQG